MMPRTEPLDNEGVASIKGPLDDVGINVTTGLNESKISPSDPREVLKYLNLVNYGTHVADFYDCEDRAFWGVVHARRRFPGVAIGVAEGKAIQGPQGVPGQDHAVIILWYKNDKGEYEHLFYEPLLKSVVDFPPVRVTSFPSNTSKPDERDTIAPLNKFTRVNQRTIRYDRRRLVYPARTNDQKGVLDYLDSELFEKECVNLAEHSISDSTGFDLYWSNTDRALWSFVHVRRAYPGCPIGVAIGEPANIGGSVAVNVIWFRDQDQPNARIKMIYWDPAAKPHIVQFTPRVTFG